MNSRHEKCGTSAENNRENIGGVNKIPHGRTKIPLRRPALGDLGNTIANQVKSKDDIQKMLEHDRKVLKNIELNDTKKPSITKNETNRNLSHEDLRRNLIRKDSIISSSSSKPLQIYDPDANSKNDVNAVTEYVGDIFSYLVEMEEKYSIEKDFLQNHKSTPSMREVLVNWVAELREDFELDMETFHSSISIIDRYLARNKDIGSSSLQLVGITAVMIANKYEGSSQPKLSDFVYVCDDSFTKHQILAMEREILRCLDFSLGRPTTIHFLRRYSKIGRVTPLHHCLGKYLLDLALMEYSLSYVRPSHLAAAACCLCIAVLEEEMDLSKVWHPTFVHYTSLNLSDFRHIIVSLAKIVKKIESSKYQALRQKYAGTSFGKISTSDKLRGQLIKKLVSEKTPIIFLK